MTQMRAYLKNCIEADLSSSKCHAQIEVSDIENAIQCLKREKQDGVFDIMSDHFIEPPVCLHDHLCILFSSCLLHGYLPADMLLSTMIPIPKDVLGDIQSSSNYRGIALSAMCSKIFEYVILVKHLQ